MIQIGKILIHSFQPILSKLPMPWSRYGCCIQHGQQDCWRSLQGDFYPLALATVLADTMGILGPARPKCQHRHVQLLVGRWGTKMEIRFPLPPRPVISLPCFSLFPTSSHHKILYLYAAQWWTELLAPKASPTKTKSQCPCNWPSHQSLALFSFCKLLARSFCDDCSQGSMPEIVVVALEDWVVSLLQYNNAMRVFSEVNLIIFSGTYSHVKVCRTATLAAMPLCHTSSYAVGRLCEP